MILKLEVERHLLKSTVGEESLENPINQKVFNAVVQNYCRTIDPHIKRAYLVHGGKRFAMLYVNCEKGLI